MYRIVLYDRTRNSMYDRTRNSMYRIVFYDRTRNSTLRCMENMTVIPFAG